MIPRLDIRFPLRRQWCYWFGEQYKPIEGEYLLNHARSGIVMALRAALPDGGKVGVVAYNCHTVANAVVNAGCVPVFVDVTSDLRIDVTSVPADLDAIVVTNLFGIRNDVKAIRKRCPEAIIIVDNAHGYGLPAEGDFTVYSINQGKMPSLGEGGILYVNKNKENTACAEENIEKRGNQKRGDTACCGQHGLSVSAQSAIVSELPSQPNHIPSDSASANAVSSPYKNTSDISSDSQKIRKTTMQRVDEMYVSLPKYGFVAQVKLFVSMLIKAIAYSKLCYWFVRRLKKNAKPNVHEKVVMRQMAPGVRRLYRAWLPHAESEIAEQRANAEIMSEKIKVKSQKLKVKSDVLSGENAFMLIAKTQDPAALKAWFAQRGVETETHFAHAIDWAKGFGYQLGSCPNAERLTHELVMIPTYRRF